MKLFTDMHHSSLLRSLVMLFEERLDIEVYRPIGMRWFTEGYWMVNRNPSTAYGTARQFLSKDQIPPDGTSPLNSVRNNKKGVYYCLDPGGKTLNRACTLDYFIRNKFDYIIASIPDHVKFYERLRARYQPQAKLIIQVGNNWGIEQYQGMNVLASIKPYEVKGVNVHFYHQEFDLNIFNSTPVKPTGNIFSFVNVLQNMTEAQTDFLELEKLLPQYRFRSYGGQNRDGNMNGPEELADKMREAEFILHSKPGGDGFGHIIHNAYASGRPLILRPSQYKGHLAEDLMSYGTYIDLDKLGRQRAAITIENMTDNEVQIMGERARLRFDEVINYDKEAEDVQLWLNAL